MEKYQTELYFNKKNISIDEWEKLINSIIKYIGYFKTIELTISIDKNIIHYKVNTPTLLPTSFKDLNYCVLKSTEYSKNMNYNIGFFKYLSPSQTLLDLIDSLDRKGKSLKEINIKLFPLTSKRILHKTYGYIEEKNKIVRHKLIYPSILNLLSVDFEKNTRYFYKKVPKYMDISKILHLLKSDKENALFSVDTFPYLQGDYYLDINKFNFSKHSLVVGSSGSGKSKFISLLVDNIQKNNENKLKYRVVIIDPHATIEDDLGGLDNTEVIDFKNTNVNLFSNNSSNPIATNELLLELFASILNNQYNPKMERMLRHSLHVLISLNDFSFANLRKLLLDIEYRTTTITKHQKELPKSVVDFFLTDFNTLKTQSYNETIAPIITFLDEMELIPIFSEKLDNSKTIKETIKDNFLTIFSLDSVSIGNKSVKTIAGLIMQNLMQIIMEKEIEEHIIFIVDEVAVVENPILKRFLSEARKYNLSLILAGQYFDQVSNELKNAIFSNVINYYLFRVAKKDAHLLASNIEFKLAQNDSLEARENMLSNLNDRDCITRICSNGVLLPAFKARTMDFKSIKRKKVKIESSTIKLDKEDIEITNKKKFSINTNVKLEDLLIAQSSSRKDIRGEINERK